MKMKLFTLSSILAISLLPSLAKAQTDSLKVYNLDQVVVTTGIQLPLKNIPQKVEIVSKAVLEAVPSENLGRALKRSINLDIIEYPGAMTTVGLRGFPPTAHSRNYTLVLIDGLPAGTNNLATIPTSAIERVEIVKGPYAVLYGSDAMGGVINIITKKNTGDTTGKVGVSVGSFAQTNLNAFISSAISSKVLFSMGFSRLAQNSDYRIGSHNLLKLDETEKNILDKKSDGDIMDNTQYSINQFYGKLEYLINSKWNMQVFSILTASNDIETPGNYWHSYGMSKKDITRTNNYVTLKYTEDNNELKISPYLSLQTESNYNNNTDSAFINSKEKIKQYGFKIANTHTWNELRWMIGFDMDDYNVSSDRFSQKLTPTNPYRPDNNRLSTSAFTEVAYVHNNFSANAGLRYNYIHYTLEANELLNNEKKSEGYNNLNPSLGIKYHFTPQLSGHASFGSGFYVPDAYKTSGKYMIGTRTYVGNKDLKPETNTSYDVGINYSLSDYISIDVTYFQNFYRDKIVTDNARKDTVSYKNAGKGNMSGIEVLLTSNLASLWNANYRLDLYGGLTYFFKNEFKDKTSDNTTITKKSLYTRRATANFGVNFNNNQGFEARFNARYIGHRLESDYMGTRLRPDIIADNYYTGGGYTASDRILQHSAHLVFDLSSYYTIQKKYRLGISLSNLLDENYTEKDGYNMPGRSVMGHFEFRF